MFFDFIWITNDWRFNWTIWRLQQLLLCNYIGLWCPHKREKRAEKSYLRRAAWWEQRSGPSCWCGRHSPGCWSGGTRRSQGLSSRPQGEREPAEPAARPPGLRRKYSRENMSCDHFADVGSNPVQLLWYCTLPNTVLQVLATIFHYSFTFYSILKNM